MALYKIQWNKENSLPLLNNMYIRVYPIHRVFFDKSHFNSMNYSDSTIG
jgi:hypothetical protein